MSRLVEGWVFLEKLRVFEDGRGFCLRIKSLDSCMCCRVRWFYILYFDLALYKADVMTFVIVCYIAALCSTNHVMRLFVGCISSQYLLANW